MVTCLIRRNLGKTVGERPGRIVDIECGAYIRPTDFFHSLTQSSIPVIQSLSPAIIMSRSNLHRHRQLAPAASVRVSPLCLGAMTFGDKQSERYGEVTQGAAFSIMDHFYKEGGNFIDTANAYQYGQSEEWVGEWMKARGNRDEIVLATKFSTGYLGDQKQKIQSNTGGNGTKSMKLSVEASLTKLQTTYIDLLYLHWWDYTVSIPELMHSLNDLIVAGKVFYLGISDAPAWVVSKANQYARNHGLRQFVVYQGMWNASMRDFEREIIPMCRDEGMGLCPYGVLNQGRFQTEEGFKEREKHNPGRNFKPLSDHDKKISKALEVISNKKGVPLLHIALAYVMQKTTYVFPIVGGRKVEHIAGSIDALSVSLSQEEMDEVDAAYAFDPGFPHTFISGTLFNDKETPRGGYTPDEVFLTKALGTFDFVEPPKPIKPAKA
jgi:aryl-alcohol dehydrogenase-like predicted oxidoreductase